MESPMTDPTAAERIVSKHCGDNSLIRQTLKRDITTALAESRREGKCEGFGEAAEMMKARKGCNCACVDIGVGNLHEPTCGLISPEEAETEFRRRSRAHDAE